MIKILQKLVIVYLFVCLLSNNANAFEENVWCGDSGKSNVSLESGGFVTAPAIFIKRGDIEAGGSRQMCGSSYGDIPVALLFSDNAMKKKLEDAYAKERYFIQIYVKGEIESGRLEGYKAYWIEDPEIIKIGY